MARSALRLKLIPALFHLDRKRIMYIQPTKPSKPATKIASLPEDIKPVSTVPSTGIQAAFGCSADERAGHRAHIAEQAYFTAEKRNFIGGDPIQDWLDAERHVLTPGA